MVRTESTFHPILSEIYDQNVLISVVISGFAEKNAY